MHCDPIRIICEECAPSYPERLLDMQPTPDTPRGLSLTFNCNSLEGLDFRARRVEQQLDLLLNTGDLEPFEANDFVPVVD